MTDHNCLMTSIAIESLKGFGWELFTCDDGYGCRIYTAPEDGDELVGEGFGDTISRAIEVARMKGAV